MLRSQESRRRNEAGEERGVDEEETEMEEVVWPASLLLFSSEAEEAAAQRVGSGSGIQLLTLRLLLRSFQVTPAHTRTESRQEPEDRRSSRFSGNEQMISTSCDCDGQILLKSPVSS